MTLFQRQMIFVFAALLLAIAPQSRAEKTSQPIGEPVLEPATLHCLAVHWLIRGDDNQNATIATFYRKTGAARWMEGPPLLRVERDTTHNEHGQSSVEIPPDTWLFAGSVFVLELATEYELKLMLHDPDAGDAERVLRSSTISEPVVRRMRGALGVAGLRRREWFRASAVSRSGCSAEGSASWGHFSA